jgi:hypothetical protein
MKVPKKRIRLSRKQISEASSDTKEVVLSAKLATSRAIRISKALDLSIKSIHNGNLIELKPNGEILVLKKIDKIKSKKEGLSKGMSLCLKSKE